MMKIQMLYRKYDITEAEQAEGDYTFVDVGLWIRSEEIEIVGHDLSAAMELAQEREGEHFINCVPSAQ